MTQPVWPPRPQPGDYQPRPAKRGRPVLIAGLTLLLVLLAIGFIADHQHPPPSPAAATATASSPTPSPTTPAHTTDSKALARAKASASAALAAAHSAVTAAKESASAAEASAQAAAVAAAAAAPPPTSAAAQWRNVQVLQVGGDGITNTESFSVTENWYIVYSYDCSQFAGGTGNFVVTAEGGDFPAVLANELNSAGKGNSFGHEAGTFYLSIDTECSFSLGVYDEVES